VLRGRKSGYAPVEMTNLFENAKHHFQDELSSRPERSAVERSAVRTDSKAQLFQACQTQLLA
jgi:hypothetical protein